MKVRIKLTKVGPIRYVGHLDFMRFFQKALRKSGIACAFSGGFSPHLLISFASPLGVGLESVGDYVDVELAYRDPFEMARDDLEKLKAMGLNNEELPEAPPSEELLGMLNDILPEGVRALEMRRVEENRGKAMAMVRGADYLVFLSEDALPGISDEGRLREFLSRESIVIHKVSKKTESDADIRPLIYDLRTLDDKECGELLSAKTISGEEIQRALAREGYGRVIFLSVSAGSAANLKPETVLEAFADFEGESLAPWAFRICRTEMYGPGGKKLGELGVAF